MLVWSNAAGFHVVHGFASVVGVATVFSACRAHDTCPLTIPTYLCFQGARQAPPWTNVVVVVVVIVVVVVFAAALEAPAVPSIGAYSDSEKFVFPAIPCAYACSDPVTRLSGDPW